MASVQKKGEAYYCQVLFKGKRHTFTIGKVSEREAANKASQVEYLLMRLKQGLIELPEGCDIVAFLQHDGKPPLQKVQKPETATLGLLRDRYLETHENGTVERNTQELRRGHFKRLSAYFGDDLELCRLDIAQLQRYVDARSKEVTATTVRKELATFRTAWNWGELFKLTSGRFPNRGLRFSKVAEKPPFMTRAEAERMIAGGGDPKTVWEAVYLTAEEIPRLLEYVKQHAAHPFIYPMIAFAAHTGARRSEIIRATVGDIDMVGGVVTLREKKKKRGMETSRRVPMSATLKAILQDWLKIRPECNTLFCHSGYIPRSKKRSRTTGHQSGKQRPTSKKGREAGLKARAAIKPSGITKDEAHNHLKITLQGSEWEYLRGWHTLRHSFISLCAAQNIDQRMVESWVGHVSPEIHRRYVHLRPDKQAEAINKAFNG